MVFCKEYWSSAERAFNILQSERNLPQVEVLPPVINPKGINRERAEYLYKEIREFCRPGREQLRLIRILIKLSICRRSSDRLRRLNISNYFKELLRILCFRGVLKA